MPHLKRKRPPGPPGLPLLGNALDFGRDALGFLAKASKYGPIVSMRLYARPYYLVHSAELVHRGLVTHASKTCKDDLFEHIRRALGDGLATSEGPLWHRQRLFFARAFTPRAVTGHTDHVVHATLSSLDQWSDGEVLELHEAASRITLEVVGRSFFGDTLHGDAPDVFRSLKSIGDYYVTALASPVFLPPWSPLPSNIRFIRSVRRIRSVVGRLIARRRETGPADDLLSAMLFESDMSEQQIMDECMTLFIAGHETSGLTLLYALQVLAERPDIEADLRDEIEDVLGGRRATSEDVAKLTRTERVIREVMRLHPSAWITVRRVVEDLELGGYVIPAGSSLMFSPWVTHRNPDYFRDPLVFDPDRWSDRAASSIPRYAYIPFGAGPRACLGNHFAMTVLVVALATFLQRAKLSLQPGQAIEHSLSVTLRPKKPVYAQLRKIPVRQKRTTDRPALAVREAREQPSRPPVAVRAPISRPPRRRPLMTDEGVETPAVHAAREEAASSKENPTRD